MEGKVSTFGERLRELRKAKGFSQRDLAALIDVNYTYLSKIEKNIPGFLPSDWLIHELALNLEADEDELVNLIGKVPLGLRKMMQDNPLLVELVRVLAEKPLPAEVYQQLLDMAREGNR